MLREWLHSVQRFPESKDIDINILDAGLTEEQKTELRPHVRSIQTPDWPTKLPARKIRGREFLKACVCRPFLPQIFPGYDIYFWMDADTWVQEWRGINLFLQGAQRKKITLTGQVDRSYPRALRVKWLGLWPWKIRGFYFSNAYRAFGFKTAKSLLPYHVLLAGAFALHRDAPHWARWQELVVQAMTKGKVFTAEQLCLGVMCYRERYAFEILPAWTHWLCEFKPLWDESRSLFVEPNLPHEPLSILHLSGYDAMRLDRSITTDFKTMNGGTVEKSYRYPVSV
ncbi:MAG: hypothetical protein K9G62_01770 [Alphaproteobacteria bacterium]|nr:hypothetical protein [Alphaproteobacteria bacterium]